MIIELSTPVTAHPNRMAANCSSRGNDLICGSEKKSSVSMSK